jgi:ribokinase
MTEGAAGGWVETDAGRERFSAPQVDRIAGGAYGAGDSFAAALTYFLAGGAAPHEAARLAAPFGAAVLAALNPLDAQRSLRAADT